MINNYCKYGCLTVLDMGEEYTHSEQYFAYKEKYDSLKVEIQSYIEKRQKLVDENPSLFEMEEQNIITSENDDFHTQLCLLNVQIYTRNKEFHRIKGKIEIHYKCQCKCGRIHYYNAKTIESKPKYCYYPVPVSTRFTYSTKARNATYRKEQKYADLECVILCDKSKCIPSENYCDYYNAYKAKQLAKNEEKLRLTIAEIPRKLATNYDFDYVGLKYESLEILECINETLESIPMPYYTQQHKKWYSDIIVYKQYRCRCYLCGREQSVTCDKFGIFPPTEYGATAYNGYWSRVQCGCHPISSFQWIVNKLLFENKIPYRVEVSFSDLYGISGGKQLRFDFAIYNEDGSIKCLIECQGEQHYKPVDEFGGVYQYNVQVKNDELKREYTRSHNIPLIEISYKDKKYEEIKEILTEKGILG